jgi:gas vesicle protein
LTTSLTSEAHWDDRPSPRVGPIATMAVGAAVGFAVGYLYLTEDGKRLRDRIEPWLDQSVDEIRRLREAALKARRAWDEGRDSFNVVRRLGSGTRGEDW